MQSTLSGVGVGPRALAVIIDTLAVGVLLCPFLFLIVIAGGRDGDDVALGINLGLQGTAFVGWLLYYVVMEAVWGATLGKLALGLRVVNVDGSKLDWGSSIVRNLLRLVDGFFSYLVAAILVWTSPTRQRLGDRVAGTMVVRKDAVPEITGFETQRF